MLEKAEEALKAGVMAIQLREKDLSTRELLRLAYDMRGLTKRYNAMLLINDRLDIALAAGADGVHLGLQGIPAGAARTIVPKDFLIGCSAHNIEEASEAEQGGADFITLGPVFQTPSKMRYGNPIGLEAVREIKSKVSIPVYAIGGIKTENALSAIEAGADGIAVISAILGADDAETETRKFMETLR